MEKIGDFLGNELPGPPILVGGTGGSGTRLVAGLLQKLGVWMGNCVNGAGDALAFVPLYDLFVNQYFESGEVDPAAFELQLLNAIRAHLRGERPALWGWKNPRVVYLLPLIDRLVPGVKFVHVIRHGVDMALSSNQNQVEKHGRAVLGAAAQGLPPPIRSALLWKVVNNATADYGEKNMPGRYFRVRYEDLCADPAGAMTPVAHALGLDVAAGGWSGEIQPADSARPRPGEEMLAAIRRHLQESLERFGYQC